MQASLKAVMALERSRSPRRSPRRSSWDDWGDEHNRDEARKCLVDMLPADIKSRMQTLEEDGTLKKGEFDPEALSALLGLTAELQDKVLVHLETERIFLMSSRSKSGFLVSACEKARTGCLDSRGVGSSDPWRAFLLMVATPKRSQIELESETSWLERQESSTCKILVDVSEDSALGVNSVALTMSLTRKVSELKRTLQIVGITISLNQMRIKEASLGWLQDERTLAYYNLGTGSILMLKAKRRGGRHRKRAEAQQLPEDEVETRKEVESEASFRRMAFFRGA